MRWLGVCRGRQELSLVVFVCLTWGEPGGIWNVPLRGMALQLEAAEDPRGAYPGFPRRSHQQRIAAPMQFWRRAVARAGFNFSTCKRRRIYLSAITVKTKWSVISKVERVTYAGKTGVSGKPGLVICGCGWSWPRHKRLQISQDLCVSGLDVVLCAQLSPAPVRDLKGGCGIANPISPSALFFLSRNPRALAPAMFHSQAFPLVSLVAAQKDLNSAT